MDRKNTKRRKKAMTIAGSRYFVTADMVTIKLLAFMKYITIISPAGKQFWQWEHY